MLSTPPATKTSPSPALIARAAALTAPRPEEQSRLNVTPATETGRPASSAAIRATLRLSSPAWFAQPRYTSSTSAGSTPARRTTSRTTSAARSSGRTSFNAPRWRPIGVRTASTITASGIGLDLRGMVPSIASGHLDFGIRSAARLIRGGCFTHPTGRPLGSWDIPLLRGMNDGDRMRGEGPRLRWAQIPVLLALRARERTLPPTGGLHRPGGRRAGEVGGPAAHGRISPQGGARTRAEASADRAARRLAYLYLEVRLEEGPSEGPRPDHEPLSPEVRSTARATRGASLRRVRPRQPARRMPPVHGRREDGPLRHRRVLVPLLLLPGVGREDVQGRRLRRREARDAGRGRPGGGPRDPGDGRGDHRRRPARCGRANVPLHPNPETGVRSDLPHPPLHHVDGSGEDSRARRRRAGRNPVPCAPGVVGARRVERLRRGVATRPVARRDGRPGGPAHPGAGGGPRPPDRVGRGRGPRLRQPERDGVLRGELPADEGPRVRDETRALVRRERRRPGRPSDPRQTLEDD